MKIGLIRETKIPVDNRVALSPKQLAALKKQFPQDDFVAQTSDIRAFSDDEYRAEGIEVVDNVEDCDLLMGIKEAKIETLIPDKHYIFFGHIAKMQAYNRPLLQAFMEKRITFSDYEYLVDDDGLRVCAFGWWAGVVGVYYTLRGYGLRHKLYELPKPDRRFTLEQLIANLKAVELPKIKMLVTGNGRVSHGAQYVLENIGAVKMEEADYLACESVDALTYTVADVDKLVTRQDGEAFSWPHFTKNPKSYTSDFWRWAKSTDVLLCGHFWAPDAPVYLSEEDLARPDLRIRMIGDVTCDIQGSIKSTLRSSTHDDPYFDYNPATRQEEAPFSAPENITVMAVDTCPNALAMDTSTYFGEMLVQHVLTPLLNHQDNPVLQRSTILENGKLTPRFDYLQDFAKGI